AAVIGLVGRISVKDQSIQQEKSTEVEVAPAFFMPDDHFPFQVRHLSCQAKTRKQANRLAYKLYIFVFCQVLQIGMTAIIGIAEKKSCPKGQQHGYRWQVTGKREIKNRCNQFAYIVSPKVRGTGPE